MAEDVAQPWLALHCQSLPGTLEGLIVRTRAGQDAILPVAYWPKTESETPDLLGIARSCLAGGDPVIRACDQTPESMKCFSEIAIPFGPARSPIGAVAVRIKHGARSADRNCTRARDHFQSGTSWLVGRFREADVHDRLTTALEVTATALEQDRLSEAATGVATELARLLDCERVSIGLMRRRRIRIEGLSNSSSFDARASLISDLEAVMDEAADQDACIVYPQPADGTPRVAMAHQDLVRNHNGATAWTVPLADQGRVIGAVTFERPHDPSPDAETTGLCEHIGLLLGPILELKRQARRSWIEATRELVSLQIEKLRAPGYPERRAIAIGVASLLLFLVFAKGDYRVTANATLEGRVQRAIVAGIDGFISEAYVRAGDLLKSGQIMARLDNRDLLLEGRQWAGTRTQLVEEHRKALAQHDRSQVNLLRAKIDQANAEYLLLAAQLERTQMTAPFDGIVVKGDLSQSLGSPVERGELLFEVAPLHGYRIVLQIDQSDIGELTPGQPGQLALTAFPGKSIPFTIKRITPVSIAKDGLNYFRVEAHLLTPVPGLQPGMQGVGKIEIDQRRMVWIWTHGLTDWLRLWAWSWLP